MTAGRPPDGRDALAQAFEALRPRLVRVAYATVGSVAEAEDSNPGHLSARPKHARRSLCGAPPRASLLAGQDRLKFWNARQSRLAMPGRPSTWGGARTWLSW